MDAKRALEGLRRELFEENARCIDPDIGSRLDYAPWGDGFRIWVFGIDIPLNLIAREPVAQSLVSLTIDSPDLGANGTCNWDLTDFADGDTVYPLLRHLRIARNTADRHNRCIVARNYDEDGVLGRIARKAPQLESLESPSAPRRDFLEADLNSLTHLRVDAGYDTQNFIRELAHSSFPPELRGLEWGDYAETYMDDWLSKTTPFDDMKALFRSEGFDQIRAFSLRNVTYDDDELRQLQALRPTLSIRVVRNAHSYVR